MIKELEIKGDLSNQRVLEEAKENGFIDIVIKTLKFQNKEDAKEYLGEINLNDKSIFVKYYSIIEDSLEDNKGLIELKENLKNEEETLSNYPNVLLQKLEEQTSVTRGCKNCKSSINIKYLIKNFREKEKLCVEDFVCPICFDKEYILNSSEEKRIDNITKRIENFREKILQKENLKLQRAKKEEVGILYGNVYEENVFESGLDE